MYITESNIKKITAKQRREEILTHIRTHNKGDVNKLAQKYKVSTVTIRNDLNYLEKKGCVTRCYGGALLNDLFTFDQALNDKKKINSNIKARLGAYAASLINHGDTVILDSGSTTEQIAYHLQDKRQLTIMTNGINIAYQLASQPDIDVMVTGGTIRKKSYSLHGSNGEELLTGFRFNKLFIGVDGFDINTGITTPHQGEADINRKMVEAAQTIIALTDSSKFGRQSFCLIARPDQLNILITDSGIPPHYHTELIQMGVDVRIID